jgi:hypothetical protein
MVMTISEIQHRAPCSYLIEQTAACGCGNYRTVAHFPQGDNWPARSRVGLALCPAGCGTLTAMPSPPAPLFCSREHERVAEAVAIAADAALPRRREW